MARFESQILYKEEVKPKIYLIILGTDQDLKYNPGQFVSLEFEPRKIRAYSILDLDNQLPVELKNQPKSTEVKSYITLLISTKPGGDASKFFEKVKVGTKMNSLGPAGRYGLKNLDKPTTLIATGTGVAPFVPMAKTILDNNNQEKVDIFFGTQIKDDHFIDMFFEGYLNKEKYPNFNIHVCFSKESSLNEKQCYPGRVTQVMPGVISDYKTTEFYICGNPYMVEDVEMLLKENGAESIYLEKYGKKS